MVEQEGQVANPKVLERKDEPLRRRFAIEDWYDTLKSGNQGMVCKSYKLVLWSVYVMKEFSAMAYDTLCE
jgi:hypothetical protein